jgi:hypothetical protein
MNANYSALTANIFEFYSRASRIDTGLRASMQLGVRSPKEAAGEAHHDP